MSAPDSSCRWEWHAVTDEMTSLKFRSDKAIAPWKRPTIPNFFATKCPSSDSRQKDLPCKTKSDKDVAHHDRQYIPLSMAASNLSSNATDSALTVHEIDSIRKTNAEAWSSQNSKRKASKTTTASSVLSPTSKKTKVTASPPKGSIQAFFSPKTKPPSPSS